MEENKEDNESVPTPSPFRETVVGEILNVEDEIDQDSALRHFLDIPKDDRSHEDFDSMIKLVRVLIKKNRFAEKELWMSHQRIFGFAQANAGLIDMNKRLAKKLISDDDGEGRNLTRVMTDYSKALVSKVTTVKLNGQKYSMMRAHFNHLCDWYCHGGMLHFDEGNEYYGPAETGRAIHKYGFGEIVLCTYVKEDKTTATEEVVLCNEEKYIADVLTAAELRRTGESQRYFTMPRFVWMKDIQPLNPRRYIMETNEMQKVMMELMGFGDE